LSGQLGLSLLSDKKVMACKAQVDQSGDQRKAERLAHIR
jgi:hypothetical protein